MKPLTKKYTAPPKSFSKKDSIPKISAKNKSAIPCRKSRTPPGSHRRIHQASVRGLVVPDKTGNQTSVSTAQHRLDQLALIAAILALIAAAIGLYIAWKTLILPGGGGTIVTV
ncbi:hypothetical protein JNUCC31_04405 [Paenibacillus sp. JNUCC31]|uniref:hypothetical protein n=1 Tax=Paenibacillus sp. JNUCC-31 TaxID=2777983 RepID=UPI00178320AE|nr:hypothetical protein [Paenibacillus sp. JNUCC-31]QOS80187.1 hypothetical protein JNUCC31_04405 [Paenibacillus sp. JNUCC-31]